MNQKRIPIEKEEPKHKKKSHKKGQRRADHKYIYKTVALHSYYDDPFRVGKIEHVCLCEVCMICGRIGNIDNRTKNPGDLEDWYCDGYFDKFARKDKTEANC